MLKTIPMQGIEARGRNGRFQAAEVTVCQFTDGTTSVSLTSASGLTKTPPVMIIGKQDDVIDLLWSAIVLIVYGFDGKIMPARPIMGLTP
jgi:hypothetical protein